MFDGRTKSWVVVENNFDFDLTDETRSDIAALQRAERSRSPARMTEDLLGVLDTNMVICKSKGCRAQERQFSEP